MDTSDDTGSNQPRLYHWILGGLFAATTFTAAICWGTLMWSAAVDDGSRISRADAVHIALSATFGFASIGAGAVWVSAWLNDRRFTRLERRIDQLHRLRQGDAEAAEFLTQAETALGSRVSHLPRAPRARA